MSNRIVTALLLVAFVLAAHAFLQIQLTSVVIAPIVFAIWFSLMPEVPLVPLLFLIGTSELLSGTPPGLMTAILLVPLAARVVLRVIPVGLSLRFLALTMALAFVQLFLMVGSMSYRLHTFTLPWPAIIVAILGSGVAAFFVSVVWHEVRSYERI